jgi:HAD superfamily hydrolase (TIGR01509 family)
MSVRFLPPRDLTPFAGFIFDCDGTLADTMSPHYVAWRTALKAGGAQFEFTWELFMSRAGMSMERTVAELSEQFETPLDVETIAREQRTAFSKMEDQVQAIGAVLDFAREVARSFPVAVASGSSRLSVERTLLKIGARELFEVIVTPEDVTRGKPHPDMFLLAAERIGIPPGKCLVLEDAELGFEAARRANMHYAVVECLPPAFAQQPSM